MPKIKTELAYEFLFGGPPFEAHDQNGTYELISKVDLRFPSDIVVSSDAKDLITRLLQRDPKKRISWEQVSQHPFIQKYKSYQFIFQSNI